MSTSNLFILILTLSQGAGEVRGESEINESNGIAKPQS